VGRLRLLLAALALSLVWPATAGAFAKTDLRLPMDDGVELAATLYVPDGPAPLTGHAAVVMLHGIGESRTALNAVGISLNSVGEQYLADGYVVLTVDLRAHGESGGFFSLDGEREVADVRSLFEWLGARPDVDESRIGVYAYSLGGGLAWRAAVEGVRFASLAVAVTWTDLFEALLPGNLAKSGAVFGFMNAVSEARTAPDLRPLRADLLASRNLGILRAQLGERSSRSRLFGFATPTLLVQGRRDFVFDIDQATAAFGRLAGPKRLYIGDFGHAPSPKPAAEVPYAMHLVRRWFDRWLGGVANGVDTEARVELAHDPWDGRTTSYGALPPTRTLRYTLRGRLGIGGRGAIVRNLGRVGTAVETFGAPVVRVRASGSFPHVVAVLKARTPTGATITVSAGGTRLTTSRRPRTVAIRLISQATAIPRGSRLTLRIGSTSGDLLYLAAAPSAARLTITGGTVSVPVLRQPVSG
jgi:pimeloyl-ACP methyl ester carboxylesterase